MARQQHLAAVRPRGDAGRQVHRGTEVVAHGHPLEAESMTAPVAMATGTIACCSGARRGGEDVHRRARRDVGLMRREGEVARELVEMTVRATVERRFRAV